MSNDQPTHTIQIPLEIWKWAGKLCGNQGIPSFLRNVLIGAMARQLEEEANSKPDTSSSKPDTGQKVGGGRGVHHECYHGLLDDYLKRHPDQEPPSVTPWTAERNTVCPKCFKMITPGDSILMTNMMEWRQ